MSDDLWEVVGGLEGRNDTNQGTDAQDELIASNPARTRENTKLERRQTLNAQLYLAQHSFSVAPTARRGADVSP